MFLKLCCPSRVRWRCPHLGSHRGWVHAARGTQPSTEYERSQRALHVQPWAPRAACYRALLPRPAAAHTISVFLCQSPWSHARGATIRQHEAPCVGLPRLGSGERERAHSHKNTENNEARVLPARRPPTACTSPPGRACPRAVPAALPASHIRIFMSTGLIPVPAAALVGAVGAQEQGKDIKVRTGCVGRTAPHMLPARALADESTSVCASWMDKSTLSADVAAVRCVRAAPPSADARHRVGTVELVLHTNPGFARARLYRRGDVPRPHPEARAAIS